MLDPETHRFINTGLIAAVMIISLITSFGLLYLMYKFYFIITAKEKPHYISSDKYSVKEDSVYNAEVQKIIIRLKLELRACKVVIGRFHNGGNYVSGLPMKKFSLTHETAGGSTTSMMDRCLAVLNSRYPEAFAQLATLEEYCISDTEDCPDANFKRDMNNYGFKATYLFLMRQFNGKEDGFVGVNFNGTTVLTLEQRHKVVEEIPRIVGLLNMQKEHLK